jgi:hypothetical protein
MDLDFIAGKFLYGELPAGKEYLLNYFKGEAEKAFLSYYFLFSRLYTEGQFILFYNNYCDHTGVCCSTRWVRKLLVRLSKIEQALETASKAADLVRVGEIKSGKASF